LRLERRLFGAGSTASILVLARPQLEAYRRAWGTPEERFRLLPPTLDPARRRPELRRIVRPKMRAELGVTDVSPVWLSVARAARTKGLDRTVAALAHFPTAKILVAGLSPASPDGEWIGRLARNAGVADRLRLLGHREDIPALMAAADLLVHPARLDITGTAILEAVANGLPAIVSGLCGYAEHVQNADAGIVLAEPFRRDALLAALAAAADASRRDRWSANGARYGADPSLSLGHAEAARLIVGPLWGGGTGPRS
jgi:UDP-glucose:(heptosyl)LPS alpha-1,3-glucosyltransferase